MCVLYVLSLTRLHKFARGSSVSLCLTSDGTAIRGCQSLFPWFLLDYIMSRVRDEGENVGDMLDRSVICFRSNVNWNQIFIAWYIFNPSIVSNSADIVRASIKLEGGLRFVPPPKLQNPNVYISFQIIVYNQSKCAICSQLNGLHIFCRNWWWCRSTPVLFI